MDEREVQVQINQMVQFIKKEAEEKSNEIKAAAQEEYTIQKQTMVEAEKAKIRKEYERKRSQIETKKKIESSTQLNSARLRVLQAQQDAVNEAVDSAKHTLGSISQSQQYKGLVTGLIVQSMMKLGVDSALKVRCMQKDTEAVQACLEPAREQYAQQTGKQAPPLSIDSMNPLDASISSGGVIVSTSDDKIVCDNTLDSRLNIVVKKVLPEVRQILFADAQNLISA